MTRAPNILDDLVVSDEPENAMRYRAEVSNHWNAPVYPNGGLTSALAIRAMAAELGMPHQTIRSFTTTFVSTVQSGAIDIAVEKLRIGNRMSQLRADVRSRDRSEPGHLVTAAFGESRDGFDFSYATPPDVASPDAYSGPPEPPDGVPTFHPPFFENVETRRISMHASFENDWEGGRAEAIRWIRYRTAPRLADGRIEPLALIPLADTMPAAVGQYLGPGFRLFHAPSVDLSMRLFSSTDDEWLLAHSIVHWAGEGYASAEITMWDAGRRLLAHANQMMLIRFPDPKDFLPRSLAPKQ